MDLDLTNEKRILSRAAQRQNPVNGSMELLPLCNMNCEMCYIRLNKKEVEDNILQDIVDRGYDPLVYKLFCYSIQYRKKLNFTWEGMDSAKVSLDRLRDAYQKHLEGNEEIEDAEIEKYRNNDYWLEYLSITDFVKEYLKSNTNYNLWS